MAKNAATHSSPAPSSASQPADSGPALAPVIEINVRHIGRIPQPEKLTGIEAPEGWIYEATWLELENAIGSKATEAIRKSVEETTEAGAVQLELPLETKRDSDLEGEAKCNQ